MEFFKRNYLVLCYATGFFFFGLMIGTDHGSVRTLGALGGMLASLGGLAFLRKSRDGIEPLPEKQDQAVPQGQHQE